MSTAKFRNQITNFKYSSLKRMGRNSLLQGVYFQSYRTPEDQLIMDFINNVDFDVLYQSKEFREMLDKRMEIKRLHATLFKQGSI